MNKALHPSDPASNATVMASAGTGKTWLLVTRLARLLLEGASPDGILAITFTRKAAAEMQTRLVLRLESLATALPDALDEQLAMMGITPTRDVRARARTLYEEALAAPRPVRTTTFHAFCQEILRRFPLEADVPPGFELVEQTGELEAAALEALQAEATRHPDGPLASDIESLLDLCGGLASMNQALGAFLSHRSDWWACTEEDDAPVEAAFARLKDQLGVEEDEDPYAAFFSVHREALAEFAELLAGHPTKTNLGHADVLATALVETEAPKAFALAATAFFTNTGSRRSRKPSAALDKKLGAERADRFLELHHGLCAAAEQTQDRINALRTLETNGAWYRTGFALLTHYQRLKREQRVLDFADLEWRAYRLLARSDNAHWVQYKLDRRIDHLLIDEFQDTNPTQWHLLLPLLEEMAAGDDPDRSRSVFLVGDAKQSIYRFRRAEPRLFEAAHQWLDERLSASLHRQHLSRRSAPAVISMVNRVFEGTLGTLLPEFDPHGTHHEDRYGRVEILPLAHPTPPPEVDTQWNGELRNPLVQPREEISDDRYLQEGRSIAARINRLAIEQTPVETDNGVRPLGFGDILILVRSRTHVAHYEKALREAGIPYTGADRGTLLESREVQDLVALLTSLIAPYDNLALATVLRSPLFACDDDDLKHLAAAGTGHWFGRLQALPENSRSSLERARRLLGRWHGLTGQLPIHDLLDRIFHEGDVLGRYESAFPPHLQSRTRANLTRFLELALEIDAGRYPSLTGFLARLERLKQREQEAPDEAPAGGAGERVRIMTIHSAKGLEAAAVFLADAAAPDGSDKGYRTLVEWPPHTPKPTHFLLVGRKADRDPLTRELLAGHEGADQRESANLLYVALTRARQYLFITGAQPSRGEDTGWWGQIVQSLTGEPEPSLKAPLVFEEGVPPPLTGRGQTVAPATGVEVPPGLTQPFRQPFGFREIAPSHRADPPAGNGKLDEDGRQRGVAVHRLLEHLTAERPTQKAEALGQIAAELNLPAETPLLRQWSEEVGALLSDPALSVLFDPAHYRQAFNEVPVLFSLSGRTVHGIIDRVLLRQDEVWIIDYKTHRIGPGATGALAAHYGEQMALYTEAAQRLWPERRVRSFILFTAPRVLEELETNNT